MPETVLKTCEEKMLKSIDSLKKEFANIRTGKANPSILNEVKVDYYGVPTPVTQVGSVSCPDAQSIVVKPWDRSILKEIAKAIQAADLGLNPLADAEVVRIPIPPLTEQTRKELAKTAKKVSEDNKVAIRNIRRDGMETLKKMEKDGLISEDELKRYTEKVQKVTDKYIEEIDKLASSKEKDIMSI